MLSYWDVLAVALVGPLFFVNPMRFRNVYRALAAYALCGVAIGAAYVLVTRPAGDWIAGVLG
ncbi:hypothetical protein ACIQWL_09080 [Streptomyces mirabilis]|uniref:hypothetical protein n=1 Tax=Streptomyces mirabilis TaxID=68239 RepID=UPI0036DBB22B